MAYCTACGQELPGGAAFCPQCGTATGAAGRPVAFDPSSPPLTSSGLEENLAGLLCYVLGWITGLVFILIDKRPFVRFHAMQSMITFGTLQVLGFILGGVGMFHMGGLPGLMRWPLAWLMLGVVNLAGLVAWILCMVRAFQGRRYKLPVFGELAENYSR